MTAHDSVSVSGEFRTHYTNKLDCEISLLTITLQNIYTKHVNIDPSKEISNGKRFECLS